MDQISDFGLIIGWAILFFINYLFLLILMLPLTVRLPTDDQLQRRGCPIVSCCGLCVKPSHFEDANHLLLCCKVSSGTMRYLVDDISVLHSFWVKGVPRKIPAITLVRWHPHSPSWIKLNTDGLAKGNPGPTASRGVFRNCRGFVKGAFGVSIGTPSAFFVEL
ncbi:hypothetical protein L1049_019784 [Liquidambar formosana]|uniref:Reverse transcriptase zinc-binding domain-containing protein n=1 Tax=Liquidambar formosana TaxID=63359 RepID=A0AAP0X376_LIQFO